MANIKVGNTNITRMSVIEPYDDSTPSDKDEIKPWVRPSEWLDMPVINSGDEKTAILLFVPSGEPYQVTMRVQGIESPYSTYVRPTYSTIDWGDGYSDIISGVDIRRNRSDSIIEPVHDYNYYDLSPDSEFIKDGKVCRQAIIQIDSSVSGCYNLDLTMMRLGYHGDYSTNSLVRKGTTNNVLDVHISSNVMRFLRFYTDYESTWRNVERIVIDSPVSLRYYQDRLFTFMEKLRYISFPSGFLSEATRTQNLFSYCHSLEEVPVMDLSNSTSASYMFQDCFNLKEINLTNTDNITSYVYFASDCSSLRKLPNIDFSNSVDCTRAFEGCDLITEIPSGMKFQNCNSLNTFFYRCRNLEYLPNDIWERCSGSLNLESMFNSCGIKSVPKVELPDATNIAGLFAHNKLKSVEFGDISNVQDTRSLFYNCQYLEKVSFDYPDDIITTGVRTMFYVCESLRDAPYFNTSNAKDFRQMFMSCYSLRSIPEYDLASCTGMLNFANNTYSLKKCGPFKNASGIKNSDRAFQGSNLETPVSGLIDSPSTASTTEVTRPYWGSEVKSVPQIYASGDGGRFLFYQTNQLRSIEGLNFLGPTSCYRMFYQDYDLVRFPKCDGSLITDATDMFYQCGSLMWSDMEGLAVSTSHNSNFLGSGALEHIFNNLASGVTGQTIDIRNNYGAAELHPNTIAIATAKGWTVTT